MTKMPTQEPENAVWGLFSFQGSTLAHINFHYEGNFGNITQSLLNVLVSLS